MFDDVDILAYCAQVLPEGTEGVPEIAMPGNDFTKKQTESIEIGGLPSYFHHLANCHRLS